MIRNSALCSYQALCSPLALGIVAIAGWVLVNHSFEEEAPQAEVGAFLARIAAGNLVDVVRDSNSTVISIRLRQKDATDENLRLVSLIPTVRELVIQGRPAQGGLTTNGIRYLSRLTNLVTMRVCCMGFMGRGVLEEICKLRQLREVSLSAACAATHEYFMLSNLTRVSSLHISYCTNYSDAELIAIRQLPNLRSLELKWTGVTLGATNVLTGMPSLTNVAFR
jgi:hypothetical protein